MEEEVNPDHINNRLAEAIGLKKGFRGSYWVDGNNHIKYRTPICTLASSQYDLWDPVGNEEQEDLVIMELMKKEL